MITYALSGDAIEFRGMDPHKPPEACGAELAGGDPVVDRPN